MTNEKNFGEGVFFFLGQNKILLFLEKERRKMGKKKKSVRLVLESCHCCKESVSQT